MTDWNHISYLLEEGKTLAKSKRKLDKQRKKGEDVDLNKIVDLLQDYFHIHEALSKELENET
jgi:hypothetical protein